MNCAHQHCNCHQHSAALSQNLDELNFSKSACAAAQAGNCVRLQSLLLKNPAVASSDGAGGTSGYSPLHYAARAGHLDAVLLLLSNGADPNQCIQSSRASSLHRAAYMGHTNIVKTLLDHGADPMMQDADGEIPLHKAVIQCHSETAVILAKSDPRGLQILDRRNQKPLDVAKGEMRQLLSQVQ